MSVVGRTFSRYVFRQVAGATIVILLSLTAVVWIGVALRQLDLMTTQGQDALRFLTMTTLALPGMLVGLFAVTSWSYQQTRQRADAQRTLARWQDQEQQRLEREAGRKTHALSEALDQAELRTREQKELLACISHDHAVAALSPGSTLVFMLIEDIIRRHRIEVIDFGFGEPARPYPSTHVLEDRASVLLFRRTLANRVRQLAHAGFRAPIGLLKRWLRAPPPG